MTQPAILKGRLAQLLQCPIASCEIGNSRRKFHVTVEEEPTDYCTPGDEVAEDDKTLEHEIADQEEGRGQRPTALSRCLSHPLARIELEHTAPVVSKALKHIRWALGEEKRD